MRARVCVCVYDLGMQRDIKETCKTTCALLFLCLAVPGYETFSAAPATSSS